MSTLKLKNLFIANSIKKNKIPVAGNILNTVKTELENKPIKIWEYFIVILGFFMSTYTLIPLLREVYGTTYNANDGDSLMQSIWLFIYAVSILTIMFYRKYIFFNLFKDKALWAIILMIYLSIYWSSNTNLTIRRAIAITLTQIFGIYIGCTFTWEKLLKLFQIAFSISSSLSLFFIIFMPGISTDPTFKNAFRGVFLHKNSLGIFMSVSILIWLFSLYGAINEKKKFAIILYSGFLLLSALLLLLSQSKTSFVVLLITIIVIFLVRSMFSKKYGLVLLNIAIFFILIASLSFTKNFDSFLTVLGKDSTLTGRVPLWSLTWEYFLQKPLLGFGYSGFWSTPNGGASYIAEVLFLSPNAHNGYLDILINLGIVGILLFLFSLQKNLFLSIELIRKKKNYWSFIPFALFVFFILYNITESFLLVQNSFTWIIFVAMSYKLRIGDDQYAGK